MIGTNSATVLCVVAHPDDEVLGAGGTLAKHTIRGDDVSVLILSDGVMARYNERTEAAEQEIKKRRDDARRACDRLGVDDVRFDGFPDNKFDTVPLLDLVQRIERTIEGVEPSILYTHHYGDINIDHRLTAEAAVTAARPLADCPVERILSFETLSSTEWGVPSSGNVFQPTVFEDITGTLDVKLEALSKYKQELPKSPHPRSLDAVRANAELWGAKSGVQAGEPFELLREVRTDSNVQS